MFEIQSDVSIPESGKGRAGIYPWASMEIGDSFFVPTPEGITHSKSQSRLCTAAVFALGRGNYATRKVTEGDPPQDGIRVWRTG